VAVSPDRSELLTVAMVKLYVALTDWSWFDYLRRQENIDEVNFWQPGGARGFAALQPGELFLFKLHAPRNAIVGGGVYFKTLVLPVSLAWSVFREKNGAPSFDAMRGRIARYRQATDARADFRIGCRILLQPVFLSESDWLPAPNSWARQIQTGKTFQTDQSEGLALWEAITERLQPVSMPGLAESAQARYGAPALVQPRLGQGAFRVAVTEAYKNRCAVTRERTLPVLEAAHIRPYARGGVHEVPNGLLLRQDLHTLFDLGYATVTRNGRFEVSRRIKEEYHNGRAYYALSGQHLAMPAQAELHPAPNLIDWHNENVFLG